MCRGTVLELRRDQLSHGGIELRLQPRVTGVGPGIRGRVDELSDVLANPRVLAGACPVALEDDVDVDARQQALIQIDRHAVAEDAVDGLRVERRRNVSFLDAVRHRRAHPDAAVASGAHSAR